MEMQWMDLCIGSISDKKMLYADQVRRILAKQNVLAEEGYKVDPAVFHYNQDGTQNNSPFPPFRITSSGKSAHIFAIGEEAVEYLNVNGHKFCRFFSNYLGRPVTEHRYSGQYVINEKRSLQEYKIANLVFLKNAKKFASQKHDLKNNTLTPEISTRIENIIREGIITHADIFNQSIEEDFTLGDISIERFVPIAVNKAGTRFNIAAIGVRFRCSLYIRGPIHVGYLKAKGFGHIKRN